MKRCRCCRQKWPPECYGRYSRFGEFRTYLTCKACRAGCKRFAKRYYHRNRDLCVARSRAWRERLIADVALARARATWDNGRVGSSDESNTIADGARVLATTLDAGVIAFRGSSS